MKNILFYLERYPGYGGIESVTTILSNKFIELGYSVCIVSMNQENIELLDKLDKRVSIFSLPKTDILNKENKKYLIELIKYNKIDFLIHQHSYAPIFKLIVGLKNKVNCKVITVEHNSPDCHIKLLSNYFTETPFHDDWLFNFKKGIFPVLLFKRKVEEFIRHRYLYKNSDKYILLSERFSKVFQNVTLTNNCQKLGWIPNPVERACTSSVFEKENIILFVGRLDKAQKRVDRLIRIFEQLNEDFNNWKLHIVGDGRHRQELESYVDKKKIKNIYFEGFQSNVTSYFQKAKIICLTSNIEGWGLVLVDAMQFGVIPFSYDSYASVFDIIENEVNGIIIPSFNEIEYANKLRLVIKDQNLQKVLSNNAMSKTLKYDIKNIIEMWENLLNQLK